MRECFHVCACNCGTKSKKLGKHYVRIQPGFKWYADGCVPEGVEVVRSFKDGKIIKEGDF